MSWFSFEICRILICEICNDIDLGEKVYFQSSKQKKLLYIFKLKKTSHKIEYSKTPNTMPLQ